MMTTNLFVIADVKQLRTGGSFRILLPFFPENLGGVGVLNQKFLTVFTIGLCLARFWGPSEFRGGLNHHPLPPKTPTIRHWFCTSLRAALSETLPNNTKQHQVTIAGHNCIHVLFRVLRACHLFQTCDRMGSYAPNSNSCISTPAENWTHVYMKFFIRNSPYCHLLRGPR